MYCHSQQVRPPGFGADQERGWGARQTRPVDHIFDNPPLLGTMRTGPDLANIGVRQPSREWHLLHLYYPPITSPGSTMPPYRFLFEHHPADGPRPEGALDIADEHLPRPGYVTATPRAEALVDYLLSLDSSWEVP